MIKQKNSQRTKFLSFLICLSVLFSVTSFSVFAEGIEENHNTSKIQLGADTVLNDGDVTVNVDFSQDRSRNYTLKETAINNSDKEKVCNQTFVFLDSTGKVVSQKRISIVVPAKKEVVAKHTSMVDLKTKYEAVTYYVSYGIGDTASEEVTLSDAELFELNNKNVPYYIKDYSVNVTIMETNKISVSETVLVHYNEESKGLSKVFVTGKNKKNGDFPDIGKLSMLSVSRDNEPANYSLRKKKGTYSYNTGLTSSMLGPHTYKFVYEQSYGNDKNNGFDKIFFSLNNGTWNVPISKMSFTVRFPKDYKASSNQMLFLNGVAQDGTGKVSYKQKGNIITGEVHRLNGTDTITFSANVEDGYFIAADNDSLLSTPMLFGILMIVLFIAFLMFSDRGEEQFNDELVTNFEIPSDLYAFEVDYIHTHSITNGLSVLLLQLVNEGYIHIEPSPVSKTDCLITKLKDYDGNNEVIKTMFEIIFGEETETDIEEFKEAYKTTENNRINAQVKSEPIFDGVFAKVYQKKNFIIRCIALFVWFMLALIPFIAEYCGIIGGLALIIMAVLLTPIHCYILDSTTAKRPIRIFLSGIVSVVSTALASLVSAMSANMSNLYVLAPQIAIMLLFYAMLAIAAWKDKQKVERTEKGREMEREVLGFERCLSLITESQADIISKDIPDYSCRVLPYTYVLFNTDTERERFVNKFKNVEFKSDSWSDFSSLKEFYEFIDGIVKETASFISIVNKPQ